MKKKKNQKTKEVDLCFKFFNELILFFSIQISEELNSITKVRDHVGRNCVSQVPRVRQLC